MAIGVKIDLKNTYKIDFISDDFRLAEFTSDVNHNQKKLIKIEIGSESHDLLNNVYNLAFGPLNNNNEIDDKAELAHTDYSKVFSTIFLTTVNYLTANPNQGIGIDGSDNSRAYYYWRIIQRNFEYLDEYFEIYGLKYYVRISRFGKQQYENPFDFEDIFTNIDRVFKTQHWPKMMYNYFVFKLNKANN